MKTRCARGENGSAVVVILVLLFVMVVFVAANTVSVNWLRKQVEVIDQRQIQRLHYSQATTNQPLSK